MIDRRGPTGRFVFGTLWRQVLVELLVVLVDLLQYRIVDVDLSLDLHRRDQQVTTDTSLNQKATTITRWPGRAFPKGRDVEIGCADSLSP